MKPASGQFTVVGPPLARLGINNKLLLPVSVNLSRRAIETQIKLRASLLRDIELVRSCLRRDNGHSISGRHTVTRRRHSLDRSSSYRTKFVLGAGPDWEDEIARPQTVTNDEIRGS